MNVRNASKFIPGNEGRIIGGRPVATQILIPFSCSRVNVSSIFGVSRPLPISIIVPSMSKNAILIFLKFCEVMFPSILYNTRSDYSIDRPERLPFLKSQLNRRVLSEERAERGPFQEGETKNRGAAAGALTPG